MLNRPSAFLQRERVCVKIRNILLNDTERTFSNSFSIQFLPAENVWNVKNFPLPLASLFESKWASGYVLASALDSPYRGSVGGREFLTVCWHLRQTSIGLR